MHVYWLEICILYIQYMFILYTIQVCMSTSDVVIQYVGCGCQSPNPQEIHCLK